jgi:hypothetical protein
MNPEQLKALLGIFLPLVDQLVNQSSSKIVKLVWPFIHSFLASLEPAAIAAAHDALPAESKVV